MNNEFSISTCKYYETRQGKAPSCAMRKVCAEPGQAPQSGQKAFQDEEAFTEDQWMRKPGREEVLHRAPCCDLMVHSKQRDGERRTMCSSWANLMRFCVTHYAREGVP